jgi:LuxR family transcriptional regulator, maltose regulon positive regulatory protein
VFADEGPPMAALLGLLIAAQRTGQAAAGVPLSYLARLQRAFDLGQPATDPGRDTAAVPGIVDPLTGRELGVLGMMAAGRSNQAIARELAVTSTRSRSTSAISWPSSARPTAPRPSPARVS